LSHTIEIFVRGGQTGKQETNLSKQRMRANYQFSKKQQNKKQKHKTKEKKTNKPLQ
jgi:hypothetical protein